MFSHLKKLMLAGVAISAVSAYALSTNFAGDAYNLAVAAEQAGGADGKGGAHSGESAGAGKGKGATADHGAKGKGGHSAEDVIHAAEEGEEEDSDKPEWAGVPGRDGKPGRGNTEPSAKKGDLFGDMYVILRDENGVPVLTPEGFVQPLDKDGNLIPLDAEGAPTIEDAVVEVEIGRLNVGRSPSHVLDARLNEAVTNLNSATSLSIDAAGRLTYVVDGVTKTIDAPLENLALYVKLLETGSLGLSLSNDVLGDYAYLNDGQLTTQDYLTAASLIGAASDKTQPMSIDQVVYVNSFLGIDGTLPAVNDIKYVDYSTFAYDRSDVYENVTTTILVKEGDNWVEKTINVYDAVFKEQDYSSPSGVDGFAQAADDARAVINYIHEYAVPADSVE